MSRVAHASAGSSDSKSVRDCKYCFVKSMRDEGIVTLDNCLCVVGFE